MTWIALIPTTGALLYAMWCSRECSRYAKQSEAAADRAEAAAQRSAEALERVRGLYS